jgi:hypothetical protein
MDDPGSSKAAFLFTDLDLANTFLDIADTTGVGFIRERNIANARKAHDTVKHFAFRIELTNSERRAIKAELRALEKRLDAARLTGTVGEE